MKKLSLPLLVGLLLILSSCDPETGILTVSGTVSVDLDLSNPKVGIFPAGSNFTQSVDNLVSYDGTFVPLVVVTSAGDSYSIDFPADLSSVGHLIVWGDSNNNNILDVVGDDPRFFPIKTIVVTDYIITGWQSVGDLYYAVDGDSNQIDLSSVGAGGFDFYDY
jgi:hypothetical protein